MKINSSTQRLRPAVFVEFRNIRTLPSGYQVAVTRAGQEFSKHFAGHSEASLTAATRWRDGLLRSLPSKRNNLIPRRVLAALDLTEPVVGVFRSAKRQLYQVSYRKNDGAVTAGNFVWGKRKNEIEAYREAVRFREEKVRVGKRNLKSRARREAQPKEPEQRQRITRKVLNPR